nr:immunoglobulin light chain junction region [Macaca mulatta]MOV76675.1 immunoglobulin light chain junction region [Macaca mulatta]MOV77487.1 immunoglobulin light chain junction region [Macaca mulatta]MOV77493.1 immunoglobulin light chain junction region [Macaca mulatta]
CQHTYGSPPTF